MGDLVSIPGLGRSPGEGKGYPLQYSGLKNPMDFIFHGDAKSRTQLSNFHFPSYIRLQLSACLINQFSSVIYESLPPHGLQHTRLPHPSPTPGACSNSSPLSWLCHPTISSSVVPFSYCLQSFPASGSFQMSHFFCIKWPKYWSFSFSISLFNDYSGLIFFRIDWFALLSIQGTLKIFLQHHGSEVSNLQGTA